MYATIRRYTAKKGSAKALSTELQKSFLPVVRSIKGFANYFYVLGGEENGHDILITVTVCQTKEGVEESVRKAATCVKEHGKDADISAPQVTPGDVVEAADDGRRLVDAQRDVLVYGRHSAGGDEAGE